MAEITEETLANDAKTIEWILKANPTGLSIDEIHSTTVTLGDPLSYRTINLVLCGMGSRIRHEKQKKKPSGKVTRFWLREDHQ